ncbi:MAG: helix-turn-helix domain-containing protein [Thermoleophilia bacterium]
MNFGDKLRQLRRERGITQDQLREKMGYATNSYVSDAERGKFIPQPERLAKWADALSMTYEEMEDVLLEYRLQDLGLDDPGFTLMFKEVPNMDREEKQSLIRAYEAVIRARKGKRKKK